LLINIIQCSLICNRFHYLRYNIGTTHGLHTAEFAEAAKTPQAHNATMRAAKCLALTGLDVLVDDLLNKEAHKEFKAAILAQKQ